MMLTRYIYLEIQALPTFLHSASSLVNEERILDMAIRHVNRKKAFFLRILSLIG